MKYLLFLIIVLIAIALLNFWHQVYFLGEYYVNAGLFGTVLGACFPLVVIGLAFYLIKLINSNL